MLLLEHIPLLLLRLLLLEYIVGLLLLLLLKHATRLLLLGRICKHVVRSLRPCWVGLSLIGEYIVGLRQPSSIETLLGWLTAEYALQLLVTTGVEYVATGCLQCTWRSALGGIPREAASRKASLDGRLLGRLAECGLPESGFALSWLRRQLNVQKLLNVCYSWCGWRSLQLVDLLGWLQPIRLVLL